MKLKVLSVLTLVILLSTIFGLKPVRASGGTVLYVDPLLSFAMPDETFTVDIKVADVEFLYSWQFNMSFDPNVLKIVSITKGDFLARQPEGTFEASRLDHAEDGWILYGQTTKGVYP